MPSPDPISSSQSKSISGRREGTVTAKAKGEETLA